MSCSPKRDRSKCLSAADSTPAETDRFKVWAVCGLLLLAVWLAFGQTVRYQFINLDDREYVSENFHVARGLSAEGICWAVTHSHHYNWGPLVWWSYMLDYQLFGPKPWGFHLTNVLLHALSAIALFLVLRAMTGCLWRSALVAAVFALHPLRAESVAWIAERKGVLSGLFFMLTIGAYLSYVRRPFSLLRYLTVLLLFALGLMAKPILVTLPFVLLLLDYWPLGRMNKHWLGFDPTPTRSASEWIEGGGGRTNRPLACASGWCDPAGGSSVRQALCLIAEKIPMLALAAASCALTLQVQGELVMPSERLSWYWRIGNVLVSYATYLRQFFCPIDLAFWYPLHTADLQGWKILGALALLAAITLGALAGWRRHPYLLVGWLWYLGMLVPVVGLLQLTDRAMADRYTYLPQIGICLALVWGVTGASWAWLRNHWLCGVASALVLAVLTGWTWRQTSFWCDSETLWTRTLACTSENAMAHNMFGVAVANQGRPDEAMAHFRTALKYKPLYAGAHFNLGTSLASLGRLDEATTHFQTALKLNPRYADAHNNYGVVLLQLGQTDAALIHFRMALNVRPDYAEAHFNLADALANRGQDDEAVFHYKRSLEIAPRHVETHCNLGLVLSRQGRIYEAASHFQQALKIDPNCADACYNLGMVLATQGRIAEALTRFRKGLLLATRQNNKGLADALRAQIALYDTAEPYRQPPR
jgi:protein O-mannosyl-transferase